MTTTRTRESMTLALGLVVGLALLGWLLGSSLIRFKEFERTVTVKGLAEREVAADTALWPITFTGASDDLDALHAALGRDTQLVTAFLEAQGFTGDEVNVAPPAVNDKLARQWGNGEAGLRYTATRTITVHTPRVDVVRTAMNEMVALGRQGVVISAGDHANRPQFVFTGLIDLKPSMVEEATRNAREVAQKFAADSESRLGKIKRAQQGVFSISDRDAHTPHLKRVRVVSTIEYYLAD